MLPLIVRASFVYSASLGERVKFICYRFTAFLFSSWSGGGFVLISFIAALAPNIDIEESVLGFHSLLFCSVLENHKLFIVNKQSYFENPASVSCVLPVRDKV